MLQSTQYNAEPVSGWMPAGGEETSFKASADIEEASLQSFDLQSLTCEVTLIDQAIAESGMADEFDLSQQDMRRLAVSANALMSVAVCAATDDEFAHLLSSFEPPRRIEEVGFLFGYSEHLRQQLLEALATSGRVEELRHSLRRRIERAHALCRKAVLSA